MVFGIIGYGRFGELLANMLANVSDTVLVYDKKHVQSTRDNIHVVNLDTVVNCNYLFLLVPVSEMENCCREIADILPAQTVVVDACSVKVHPVSVMRRHLKKSQPIIATHPLFGPDSVARSGLVGHTIVVSPVRISDSNAREIESIFEKLSLKIKYSTPEEHDKIMARTQALVHFFGRGISTLNVKAEEFSTPDYQSFTRMNSMVENDTWQLFFDMQKYNPYARDMRRTLLESIQRIERSIDMYAP